MAVWDAQHPKPLRNNIGTLLPKTFFFFRKHTGYVIKDKISKLKNHYQNLVWHSLSPAKTNAKQALNPSPFTRVLAAGT